MLHRQIEHDETVERYVQNRLAPEERQAFEEHYFACDECFEKVQAMERFAAGVSGLVRGGELHAAALPSRFTQLMPWLLSGTSFAAIALGMVAGWAYLHRIPLLKQELRAANSRAQTQIVAQLQSPGNPDAASEANVPLVMLESSRGKEATTISLAPEARQLIVWAEIGSTRYQSYRMEIYSVSGHRVLTVDGLVRGPYGALAASLPADQLRPGTFRITLRGETPPPASLVSDYLLEIRRP